MKPIKTNYYCSRCGYTEVFIIDIQKIWFINFDMRECKHCSKVWVVRQ